MKKILNGLKPPRTRLKSKYFPFTVIPANIDWQEFEIKYNEVQFLMKTEHRWFESGHCYDFKEAEHKKIILGRGQFYIQFADFMYEKYKTRYYLLDFMTRIDDISAYDQLLFYILDAEEIHINLEGINIKTLKNATIRKKTFVEKKEDIPSFHTTAWEINQVFHRNLLDITYFHTGSTMTRKQAWRAMGKKVPLNRILDDNKHLIKEWLEESKNLDTLAIV